MHDRPDPGLPSNAKAMENFGSPGLLRSRGRGGRASPPFSSPWGWLSFATGDAWNLPSQATGVVGVPSGQSSRRDQRTGTGPFNWLARVCAWDELTPMCNTTSEPHTPHTPHLDSKTTKTTKNTTTPPHHAICLKGDHFIVVAQLCVAPAGSRC